jgi:hypothetical protein
VIKDVAYYGPLPRVEHDAIPEGTQDIVGMIEDDHRVKHAILGGAKFTWEDTPEAPQHNRGVLDRWEAEQKPKPRNTSQRAPSKDKKRHIALKILDKVERKLSDMSEGVRDTAVGMAIKDLAKFHNEGCLSEAEIHDAIVRAAYANELDKDRENGGIEKVKRDVPRCLAANAGLSVDWPRFDWLYTDDATPKTAGKKAKAAESSDAATEFDAGLPKVWNAKDLKPAKAVEWLAISRIPRAAVTLLIGEEGIGKSLLWVWLVVAITTGKALPEFGIPARDPARVILVLTEDDWQTTVLPRLEVAGAKISMVQVICTEDDGSGSPIFPRDLHLVYEASPAMLVVDAWLDTVPHDLKVADPQQARIALHPYKDVATQTGAAVVLVTHANRVQSPNARDRYGGTYALRQKARMSLFALENEDGRLVVGPDKANLSVPVPATVFGKQSIQVFDPTPDSDGTVPKLIYVEQSDATIREHLIESYATEHDGDDGGGGEVLVWLSEFLSQGPRPANDVLETGLTHGFKDKRVRTAKRKLAVVAKQTGKQWFWCLPRDAHKVAE